MISQGKNIVHKVLFTGCGLCLGSIAGIMLALSDCNHIAVKLLKFSNHLFGTDLTLESIVVFETHFFSLYISALILGFIVFPILIGSIAKKRYQLWVAWPIVIFMIWLSVTYGDNNFEPLSIKAVSTAFMLNSPLMTISFIISLGITFIIRRYVLVKHHMDNSH